MSVRDMYADLEKIEARGKRKSKKEKSKGLFSSFGKKGEEPEADISVQADSAPAAVESIIAEPVQPVPEPPKKEPVAVPKPQVESKPAKKVAPEPPKPAPVAVPVPQVESEPVKEPAPKKQEPPKKEPMVAPEPKPVKEVAPQKQEPPKKEPVAAPVPHHEPEPVKVVAPEPPKHAPVAAPEPHVQPKPIKETFPQETASAKTDWKPLSGSKLSKADDDLLNYKKWLNKGYKSGVLTKVQCVEMVRTKEIELGLRPPE